MRFRDILQDIKEDAPLMLCVDVAVNLPVKSLFRQFTYLVPQQLEFLDSGWRVVVPFGGRTAEGFVVRKNTAPSACDAEKLKYVTAALGREPWFDKEMLATANWLASYYMCSLAEAMRLFVPGKSSIRRTVLRDSGGKIICENYAERLKEKTVLAYKISKRGTDVLAEAAELFGRAKAQRQALEFFGSRADEWFSISDLAAASISRAVVKSLLEKGFLEESSRRVLRDSYAQDSGREARGEALQLTDEQSQAVSRITDAVKKQDGRTFLLQGITGSGKTEVYLRCAAQTVASGHQVLMLVPEIALTAQLVKRFQAWFGSSIAVAHSKLSQNERGDVWHRMRSGQASVLIGVRSAVFAPFADLGLVIIDEEHESSYKQEERPNYHARDVALQRCRHMGAPLILGSATPDITTYYAARQGRFTHLRLTKRANGSRLPQVVLADMRAELAARNFSVLSRSLRQQLLLTAAAGEQAIVLLNRRGYSTFVMCRDCGHTVSCPHCAVALVYHSAGEAMRCHYCGNTAPIPSVCPECGSRRIKFFGTGTQKAEQELAELPELRVLRMDQDSTMAKFAHLKILQQFAKGSYNTLIGTQMVAKGHDIPNVTLVGVLSADASLHLPDYRAQERTFSLLTQAAGRAGRGGRPGQVIFQTYEPDNAVLQLAARQDYDSFAALELAERERFFYPPFAQLLKITVWDKDAAAGLALAKRLALYLQGLQAEGRLQERLELAGPFPALVAKVRDLYRFNILLKAEKLQPVKEALLASEFKERRNIYFDVDPASVV